MGALLDKSVLQLHGIWFILLSERDETRAHNLTFGGAIGMEAAAEPAPSEESSEEPQGESAIRQAKRPQTGTDPEGVMSSPRRDETARFAVSGVAQGFHRKWQKKTSRGPRGAKRLGETLVDPMEMGSSDSEDGPAPQPSMAKRGAVVDAAPHRVDSRAGTVASNSRTGDPHRPGKEPAGDKEKSFTPAGWPSPYYMAESEARAWAKTRDLLIGKIHPSGSHEEEPDSEHRFDPASHMDVRSSVLKSRYMQAKAVEQFSLPNDDGLLKDVPDVGLHVILRSYLPRGCLVEQEIYRRLARGHHAFEKLRKAGGEHDVAESAELDRVVADLSAKQAELDD